MRFIAIIFGILVYLFYSQSQGLSDWESLSIALFAYFTLDFLICLGKRIVILELPLIIASLTCLVLPVLFYHFYTPENDLARLWGKYMPVSSDAYFSFAVPSVIALAIGIRLPLGRLKINSMPKIYMENVQTILQDKSSLGLKLIGVGVTAGLLDFLSPGSLKQVFYLMDHLTYVGAFYVIYSPNKYKRIIIPSVFALMIGQALITGMFGEFINLLACSVVLVMLGKKISLGKKLGFAVAGLFLIVLMQSVKVDYRKRIWQEGTGADPVYYAQLVGENVADPSKMMDPNRLFFLGVRMNQGWLVAKTMYCVPASFDFANGETIWQSIAATVVPRFIWPDKPEAGGHANIKRFWGYSLRSVSMNIGPMGEAYANFDVQGGIIFMFFYGLFFNFMMSRILKMSEKRPTLVLWIPFLFYYAIGVETDLLTTMGSLVKGVIFVYITFWAFRTWFNTEL